VFLRHAYGGGLTPLPSLSRHVAPQGAVGVSFFFVLSGFVLSWGHGSQDTASGFLRRRVARILPAYWVAAAIAVSVHWGALPSTLHVIAPFSLLQTWVPKEAVYYALNPPFWSLSAEAFFYVAFLWIGWRLASSGKRSVAVVAAAAAAVSIAVPLALHPEAEGGRRFWLIYIFPPFRLLEFVVGICLARLLILGVRLRLPVAPVLVLSLMAYVAAGFAPKYAMWTVVTLIPFALLIFACAEADLEMRATGLRHPVLIRLGQWSFAFYLLHTTVDFQARHVLHYVATHAGRGAAVVLAYALATLCAYLLFRIVEYPLERMIRGGSTATPPAEVALAAGEPT
jgi:peptidoglycan/LPS O-acetylase OafA/YrhL